MEVLSLTCPTCGGTIEYKEGTKIQYCQHCGSKLLVDTGDRVFTIRDEAELKKLEIAERKEAEQQAEKERKLTLYKKRTKIWYGLVVGINILFILFALISKSETMSLGVLYLCIFAPFFKPINHKLRHDRLLDYIADYFLNLIICVFILFAILMVYALIAKAFN